MMGQRLRLEVFETGEAGEAATLVLNGEDFEDARLAAFEQGYRAGWDDAMGSEAEEGAALRAAIAARLEAIAAGVAQVRGEILAALRPLIEAIVASLLPGVARLALPGQIADALVPFAELATDTAIELVVNPAAAAAAEAALVAAACPLPIQIREDAALGDGQAVIRLASAETLVDLDTVIARVSRLVADYFDQIARERQNG
jgi:flagellar assembly protein FliH